MKNEEVEEKWIPILELAQKIFPDCAIMLAVMGDSQHVISSACCKCMAEDITKMTNHWGYSPKHPDGPEVTIQ